jgi:hypothetical protein
MANSDGTDAAIGFIILLFILAAIGAAAGGSATASPVDNDRPGQHATVDPEPAEDVCADGCEGY